MGRKGERWTGIPEKEVTVAFRRTSHRKSCWMWQEIKKSLEDQRMTIRIR